MAITLLIRTSNRPDAFNRCIASIDYPAKTVITYDNPKALDYIDGHTAIEVQKNEHKYGYNLYCGVLLNHLTEGHGIYLDDNDTLIKGSLQQLDKIIQPGKSYIIQFLRDNKVKPWGSLMFAKAIVEGCIGLPCLVLWHEHKRYVRFDHTEISDFRAIEGLSKCVKLKWLTLAVVNSPKRNYGRME